MRQDVADVFLNADPPEPTPVLKALSVRMPADVAAYIERLAEAADLSRTAMAVCLLRWGIDFALHELPPDMHVSIVSDVEGPEAAGDVASERFV